jgi:hypothetical protein
MPPPQATPALTPLSLDSRIESMGLGGREHAAYAAAILSCFHVINTGSLANCDTRSLTHTHTHTHTPTNVRAHIHTERCRSNTRHKRALLHR